MPSGMLYRTTVRPEVADLDAEVEGGGVAEGIGMALNLKRAGKAG